MAESPFFLYQESIDLNKPLEKRIMHTFFASGDKNAHRFEFTLMRGRDFVNLDGAAVTASLIPYSTKVTMPGTGRVENGKAVFEMPAEFYNIQGLFCLFITVSDANTTNTIFAAEGRMTSKITDSLYDPEDVVPNLSELLAQIAVIREATTNANKATSAANTAASNANAAADNAISEAEAANTAAANANKWGNATATATKLAAGAAPTVGISDDGTKKTFNFGIPKGDKGEQGVPFLIKGDAFPTLAALQAGVTNPETGDQYNVGTSAPYNVYRWTGSKWENQGQIGSAAIDATLTQSGQAADAKATGDSLKQKLALTGGTLSGNLTMNSDEYIRLRINRSIDGVKHCALLAVSGDGTIRISKNNISENNEETEKNYLVLQEGETVFGKPVTIASGGTGASTAKGAEYNISGGIAETNDAARDDIGIVCAKSTPNASNGVFYKRKASNLWEYIAGKIRSVFGFSQLGVLPAANGGTGKTSLADVRGALGVSAVEFTDSVTFNTPKNFAHFRCMGEMAFVQYQSQSAAIDVGTVLFTLPLGSLHFAPVDRYIPVPFVVDGTAYGRALIDNTTGECKVTRISSAATGIVVINVTYYVNRLLPES